MLARIKKYKKLKILLLFAFVFMGFCVYSQPDHSFKLESGFIKYGTNIVYVDPGPYWKGYNIDEENGIDLNFINSFSFNDKFYWGVGLGYMNFEGNNGLSLFSDFEYLAFKYRLQLLLAFKAGYSHIWNQYENGTGTMLVEYALGLNFKMTDDYNIYFKTGFLLTQQSLLFPFRIGIKF